MTDSRQDRNYAVVPGGRALNYNSGPRNWDWNGRPIIFGGDRASAEGVADHALTMARLSRNRLVECSVTLDDDGVTVEAPVPSPRGQTERPPPMPTEFAAILDETSFVDTEMVHVPGAVYWTPLGERVFAAPDRAAPVYDTVVHDAVSIRARPSLLGEVVGSILSEGRWVFDGGSYLVTGVVGHVTFYGGGRTQETRRSALEPHEYTVQVRDAALNRLIRIRDLDLRRWDGRIPEIYVHLVSHLGETAPETARVPISEATPLTTRVYGAVGRMLQLEGGT